MNKEFFLVYPLLVHTTGMENDFESLLSEEKDNMNYFEDCLYNSNEKFSDACFHIMLLVLEITSKLDTDEEITYEEVQTRKNKILDDFNYDDKDKLEYFMYVCIQNMGIYSEERVLERKIKNERND